MTDKETETSGKMDNVKIVEVVNKLNKIKGEIEAADAECSRTAGVFSNLKYKETVLLKKLEDLMPQMRMKNPGS